MVAIYKNPGATLREWAHPYRQSHPEFVQGLEDVADSFDVVEQKVADFELFDLDAIKEAAAALSVPFSLGPASWGEEHTGHVKDLVALADAFDAMAVELREPGFAAQEPAECRKLMILTARRSRAFSDLLDVVLVGEDSREPDFAGYDKAVREDAEAWNAWVKTFVDGLVEYREASNAARKTADVLQLEHDGLRAEVASLRAELDALKAAPAAHDADLQDQAIKATAKASRYAFTLEQIRNALTELDKSRGA